MGRLALHASPWSLVVADVAFDVCQCMRVTAEGAQEMPPL